MLLSPIYRAALEDACLCAQLRLRRLADRSGLVQRSVLCSLSSRLRATPWLLDDPNYIVCAVDLALCTPAQMKVVQEYHQNYLQVGHGLRFMLVWLTTSLHPGAIPHFIRVVPPWSLDRQLPPPLPELRVDLCPPNSQRLPCASRWGLVSCSDREQQQQDGGLSLSVCRPRLCLLLMMVDK